MSDDLLESSEMSTASRNRLNPSATERRRLVREPYRHLAVAGSKLLEAGTIIRLPVIGQISSSY